MTFLNRIGLFFVRIGILIGTYFSFEWYKEKSSMQDSTMKGLKHFKELETKSYSAKEPVNSQVPSSQMQYKEGEKGATLNIPKINKKVFYSLGS